MASDRGRSLPKFGEWDVNNPASAEGFTVIFSKARDEKRTTDSGNTGTIASTKQNETYQHPSKRRWFVAFESAMPSQDAICLEVDGRVLEAPCKKPCFW